MARSRHWGGRPAAARARGLDHRPYLQAHPRGFVLPFDRWIFDAGPQGSQDSDLRDKQAIVPTASIPSPGGGSGGAFLDGAPGPLLVARSGQYSSSFAGCTQPRLSG